MKPFISIIMAVYNNEKYFPTAVNSILNQSFHDFELIIVDDGSTDNTSKIADEFAKKDNRIKVIHQENQWVYTSFNNGISASNGEYVMIVNSDDTINPDSLKEIHKEATLNNPDMIIYNWEILECDENQKILKTNIGNQKSKIIKNDFFNTPDTIRNEWPILLEKSLVFGQNIYKSTLAKKNLFRNDIYMADAFYNMNLARQISSFSTIPYVVYNHFIYNTLSNASTGKYYNYEHSMFNDFFIEYKKLFSEWNLDFKSIQFLHSLRLKKLSAEFRKYNLPSCPLSNKEKTEKIFFDSVDDIVYECAILSCRKEELEARILSALREIFLTYIPPDNTEARLVYDMLESLLRYEKDETDIEKIKKCVYHEKNKYNIGEEFLKKLLN